MSVALFGAALSLTIIGALGQHQILAGGMTLRGLWICLSGAIGGAAAFALSMRWLGHPGKGGWMSAIWGLFLLCFTGALIGGSLALPFYGTMFGPMMLGLALLGSPIITILWIGVLLGVHLQIRQWRRERETIFVTARRR
ncbi:MAG: hypothetical protein JJT81_18545 [Rubellimicrobium sp.]|nr:hypothetical protein [Rubellimicrobium sp.]